MKRMDKCCEDLAKVTGAKSQVYGFDFTIILPLVLDILMKVIGDCGGSKSVVDKIESKSYLAQWAVRKAIKTAAKNQDIHLNAKGYLESSNDVLDWASKNGALVKEALEEMEGIEEKTSFDNVWS